MKTKGRNRGQLAVMVVCAVVGFLLAAQLRSVKLSGAADATNAARLETLQSLYNELMDQKDGLEDQVKQLQSELALYRDQAASGEAGSEALKAEVDKLEITAGLTDVEGPGVSVILEDSSSTNVTGAVVTVNGRRYAAPYVIFAIGDPDTLYSAMTMRNGVADVLGQWGITVKVTASDLLLIPKYNGTVDYQYAHSVTPGEEEGEG